MHVILLGRQGSGKTSIAHDLEKHGYRIVQSVTTRPPRPSQDEHQDYQFVNDDIFNSMNDHLYAIREYNTTKGVWRYGIDLNDINANEDNVTILDPEGFMEIRDKVQDRFAVYLDVPASIRINRVLTRGDDYDEVFRRETDDAPRFEILDKKFKDLCDLRSDGRKRTSDGNLYPRTVEEESLRIRRYISAFKKDEIDYDEHPEEGDDAVYLPEA